MKSKNRPGGVLDHFFSKNRELYTCKFAPRIRSYKKIVMSSSLRAPPEAPPGCRYPSRGYFVRVLLSNLSSIMVLQGSPPPSGMKGSHFKMRFYFKRHSGEIPIMIYCSTQPRLCRERLCPSSWAISPPVSKRHETSNAILVSFVGEGGAPKPESPA